MLNPVASQCRRPSSQRDSTLSPTFGFPCIYADGVIVWSLVGYIWRVHDHVLHTTFVFVKGELFVPELEVHFV